MYLLEKYPKKPWDWWNISRNPNFDKFMLSFLINLGWDVYLVIQISLWK